MREEVNVRLRLTYCSLKGTLILNGELGWIEPNKCESARRKRVKLRNELIALSCVVLFCCLWCVHNAVMAHLTANHLSVAPIQQLTDKWIGERTEKNDKKRRKESKQCAKQRREKRHHKKNHKTLELLIKMNNKNRNKFKYWTKELHYISITVTHSQWNV